MYKPILALLFSISVFPFACGDKPTESGDTTAPKIISKSPDSNSENIPVSDSVIITFSEKINTLSVLPERFRVAPENSINPEFYLPGNIIFENNSAIFIPSLPLSYNTIYKVRISDDIKDLAGNKLADSLTWTFTTQSEPAPQVITVSPFNNATFVDVNTQIRATFSTEINPATATSASFSVSGDVSGQLNTNSNIITFIPDTPLEYDSLYTATVTTAIESINGLNLENNFSWSFRTVSLSAEVIIISPRDSAITGDSVYFQLDVAHPIGVESVDFYIDGIYQSSVFTKPFNYLFIDQNMQIGSEHTFYSIAYDSAGNTGYSDTTIFFYLWQELIIDGNDGFNQLEVPNDLRRMLARSTDSTLELRYEYAYDWEMIYSNDTISCKRLYCCHVDSCVTVTCSDTAVDLGIYIDSDLDPSTGRVDGAADLLNGIGADYRIILGLHGGDTTLSVWNENDTVWQLIYDTTGALYHFAPQNSNYMEIGIRWDEIGNTDIINIVNANVFFRNFCDPNDFLVDFMPDRGNGHVTIYRDNRYIGPIPASQPASKIFEEPSLTPSYLIKPDNPFD